MTAAIGPVVLLIRSLEAGGAERQVIELSSGLRRRGVDVVVITFYDGGAMSSELCQAGVTRISLRKRHRWDLIAFAVRLLATLRRLHPAVLYSFLPGSNIFAALARPGLRGTRLVWGVRASNLDLSRYDRLAKVEARAETLLARIPDLIIANSEAGRRHILSLGFPSDKLAVVHNGIDTQRFSFDSEARRCVRAAWKVADGQKLVGIVARIDPMKDHANFLRAAAAVAADVPESRFVCVGGGSADLRQSLQALAVDLGLKSRVIWSDQRQDMPAVFSALDVGCSASVSEGFSNAIGEAMSTGVPCVGTDVGDTSMILGDTGLVVPPRNPAALARALVGLLQLDSAHLRRMGANARQRIVENFSIDVMVDKTLGCLATLR